MCHECHHICFNWLGSESHSACTVIYVYDQTAQRFGLLFMYIKWITFATTGFKWYVSNKLYDLYQLWSELVWN